MRRRNRNVTEWMRRDPIGDADDVRCVCCVGHSIAQRSKAIRSVHAVEVARLVRGGGGHKRHVYRRFSRLNDASASPVGSEHHRLRNLAGGNRRRKGRFHSRRFYAGDDTGAHRRQHGRPRITHDGGHGQREVADAPLLDPRQHGGNHGVTVTKVMVKADPHAVGQSGPFDRDAQRIRGVSENVAHRLLSRIRCARRNTGASTIVPATAVAPVAPPFSTATTAAAHSISRALGEKTALTVAI